MQEDWDKLLKKWDVKTEKKQDVVRPYGGLNVSNYRNTRHIPSLDTGTGSTVKKETPVYTGNEMIGISVIHKSCLQPIFNKENAKEVSNMRR